MLLLWVLSVLGGVWGARREGALEENVLELVPTARPLALKTYILTKRVPFAVQVPVRAPIRRPYAVLVPRPYILPVPKPVPYAVKVPLPHHLAFPYKVPLEKPVPVALAKPVPLVVEKKVPVPVERPVQVEKLVPVQVEAVKTLELQQSQEFAPSPQDATLDAQGKHQKVITFLPTGSSQTQEPSSQSEQAWSPLNSTNDWVPRYVTAVQNTLYQDPVRYQEQIKFVPSPQQSSVTEPKLAPLELSSNTNQLTTNLNYQQIIRTESQPTPHTQVFNFATTSEKPTVFKFEETDFGQKLISDGNYQFFNVHSNHDSKSDPQISGVSFQRYESETKPSENPSTSNWVKLQPQDVNQNTFQPKEHPSPQNDQQISQQNSFQPPDQSINNFQNQEQQIKNFQQHEQQINNFELQEQQATSYQTSPFQQEQHIGQQIKKEDMVLAQPSTLVQQFPEGFNPNHYHQYKVYYQGPNQDHFQKNQPEYVKQQDTAAITQTQFKTQKFHQLESYQKKAEEELSPAVRQFLRQTVVPSRRRPQRQTTPQPTTTSSTTPPTTAAPTTSTEPAARLRKTKRRLRKRANATEPALP